MFTFAFNFIILNYMKSDLRRLAIQQIDKKNKPFISIKGEFRPEIGWIKAIREALNISQTQLGKKLKITKQGVSQIENGERNKTITLTSLQEAAKALDLKLVYALVPKDCSLEKLIERKANELAKKIVMRTSAFMKLEAQEVSKERLKKAIEEKAYELRKEIPSELWD